jgi:hypothetical protein
MTYESTLRLPSLAASQHAPVSLAHAMRWKQLADQVVIQCQYIRIRKNSLGRVVQHSRPVRRGQQQRVPVISQGVTFGGHFEVPGQVPTPHPPRH